MLVKIIKTSYYYPSNTSMFSYSWIYRLISIFIDEFYGEPENNRQTQ
jgi:hypothetical protein